MTESEKNNSHKKGKEGEEAAVQFLKSQGYTILEINWRFKKYEIDVIAKYDNLIVFVEVKARSSNAFGEPEWFVNKTKQKFLITAANHYIQQQETEMESRFDIVSVLYDNNNKAIVKHLEDAFYASLK